MRELIIQCCSIIIGLIVLVSIINYSTQVKYLSKRIDSIEQQVKEMDSLTNSLSLKINSK